MDLGARLTRQFGVGLRDHEESDTDLRFGRFCI